MAECAVALLRFMPDELRKPFGLPDEVPMEAAAALCEEIKAKIFTCVCQVKQAWAHWNGERDRQLQASDGQPQASDGQSQVSTTEPGVSHKASSPAFKIGDEIISHSEKHKELYDKRCGVVVGVFTNHYRVKINEGPAVGKIHKFVHSYASRSRPRR